MEHRDPSFVFSVSVKMYKCNAKGQGELGCRQASDRPGSEPELYFSAV